jgi:hypothetical protein
MAMLAHSHHIQGRHQTNIYADIFRRATMAIRLTDTALDRIEQEKSKRLKQMSRHGMGIHIGSDVFGAKVYINDHYICDFTEMGKVAEELQLMVDIVKDAIGIYED